MTRWADSTLGTKPTTWILKQNCYSYRVAKPL